jgi:hypothetical protein
VCATACSIRGDEAAAISASIAYSAVSASRRAGKLNSSAYARGVAGAAAWAA